MILEWLGMGGSDLVKALCSLGILGLCAWQMIHWDREGKRLARYLKRSTDESLRTVTQHADQYWRSSAPSVSSPKSRPKDTNGDPSATDV